MTAAIHIEIDVLFLLILCVIAHQSVTNVSQQMGRVLFRYTVYGIIFSLALDTIWMLIDGRLFPGAIFLNLLVNALFLSCGILLGCIWYLYVLETLGYKVSQLISVLILTPGFFFLILNVISMKTGSVFYITEENIYVRGPQFSIQSGGAIVMLMVSLIHILIRFIRGDRTPEIRKLLLFYILPVVGTLITLPFTGMPGTWPCAAVSIIMIYIADQDEEITRDSLTGLNNRKTLARTFAEYIKVAGAGQQLYLYVMDLDRLKEINDTYGHSEGDKALIAAAKVFLQSIQGLRSIAARIGGDEFLILAFLPGEEAASELKNRITQNFEDYNSDSPEPYTLQSSVGYCLYGPDDSLSTLMERADKMLYEEKSKKRRNTGS